MTEITDHFFYHCHSLKAITLPKSITKIGKYAFVQCPFTTLYLPKGVQSLGKFSLFQCSKLEFLYIPSTLTSIGESAISECTALKDIYCDCQTPPTCERNVFSGSRTVRCTLHVPIGTSQAYQTDDTFKIFSNIVEEDMSDIDPIMMDRNESQIHLRYSPNGTLLQTNRKGFNIIKNADGTARKIFCR